MRILLLLVLGLAALEAGQRMHGQSMLAEIRAWMDGPGACARLGPSGDAAIPILVRCIKTGNKQYRGPLACTIEQFGPRATSALPALRTLSTSIDEWEARAARSAIAAIEKRAP